MVSCLIGFDWLRRCRFNLSALLLGAWLDLSVCVSLQRLADRLRAAVISSASKNNIKMLLHPGSPSLSLTDDLSLSPLSHFPFFFNHVCQSGANLQERPPQRSTADTSSNQSVQSGGFLCIIIKPPISTIDLLPAGIREQNADVFFCHLFDSSLCHFALQSPADVFRCFSDRPLTHWSGSTGFRGNHYHAHWFRLELRPRVSRL